MRIASDGKVGIKITTPQRTLHVGGEVRITDLTTDTPTRIVGADADGDLGEMTAGTGISFAGGQVSATFDIADVGTNLSAYDVPVWAGAEFQPSGITSDGSLTEIIGQSVSIGAFNTVSLSADEELSLGSTNSTITIDANQDMFFQSSSSSVKITGKTFVVITSDTSGYVRMGPQGGGTGPTSSHNVTVFEGGLIRVNSPDISFPSTEESTELGQVKVLVLEDSMLFYKDMILDKQSATFYEEVERQYTLGTSPAADTVITIDTIGVAFAADSISIDAGLITNDRSTTVTWMVHYDFTYNSDEDPCYSFFDLTTDGSDVPVAIAGSKAYSEQVSILNSQHPGRSFLVNVPSGQAIRLCVKGNVLAATEMNISHLTITIQEQ